MPSPRKAALILQGFSAYNNFDAFYRMVGMYLEKLGLDPVFIDLRDLSKFNSGMTAVVAQYSFDGILAAFTLNGLGLEIGDTSTEGNLWHRLKIPVLSWMGDHPAYYLSRHQHKSPAIMLMYEYKDYLDFHRDYVCSSGRTAYAPFGVWDLGKVPQKRRINVNQSPLIIMPKTGNNPLELEDAWKNIPQILQGIIFGAIEHYWDTTSRSGTVTPSVLASADAVKLELRNDLDLLSFLIVQTDDYIRRRKAKQMMSQLLKLPVQIIGSGLDYLDTSDARATFVKPMDYAQLADLYYTADAIVTMNPNVDDECHDRVYSALGCGALPVTDINPWWEKKFPALLPYSYDFLNRGLTQAVESILDDPLKASELAWQQRDVALGRRTFEDTVREALDFAMMQRYYVYDFKPPQAYFAKSKS